jgi:hypothetical protein
VWGVIKAENMLPHGPFPLPALEPNRGLLHLTLRRVRSRSVACTRFLVSTPPAGRALPNAEGR